jgi:polyhydroxyalkanoate synthesis regulator protein
MMDNMASINPMASMPGFDAMRAQQEAFFKAMSGGAVMGAGAGATEAAQDDPAPAEELDEIKRQLADLQSKLSKM